MPILSRVGIAGSLQGSVINDLSQFFDAESGQLLSKSLPVALSEIISRFAISYAMKIKQKNRL